MGHPPTALDRCEDPDGWQPNRCPLLGTDANSVDSGSFEGVRGACVPTSQVYGAGTEPTYGTLNRSDRVPALDRSSGTAVVSTRTVVHTANASTDLTVDCLLCIAHHRCARHVSR